MDTIYSSLLPMTSAPYLHCIGDAHVIKADFSLGLSGVFNAQTSPFPKHFSLGFPIKTLSSFSYSLGSSLHFAGASFLPYH